MHTGFTLDPKEKVIHKVHRHWADLVPVAISATVLILLVITGVYFFARYPDAVPVPAPLVGLLTVLILMIAAAMLISALFVYRQSYLLLTNLHLINVQQKGLFSRSIAQLSLARVQDVSAKRAGLLATIFNFGNIEVQSAGEEDKFTFRNAPSPHELADQCLLAHEEFVKIFPERG